MKSLTLQQQVDILRRRIHNGLRAMVVVVVLMMIGMGFTGWQIKKAFDNQDTERLARIGASASINTFLCQRIDSVGNGVASLVRVSLAGVQDPAELSGPERASYERFVAYAEEQERPPRCKELALKVATLTGADPTDVVITPIRLHRSQ